MYKFIGVIFVFVSSVVIFSKDNIKSISTYRLLKQSAEVATYLKFGCSSGKTYNQIFSEIDFSQYSFYRNFDYSNLNFPDYLTDKQRLETVRNFYLHLGERNKYSELEYISRNIDIFEFQADKFKNDYDKNRQASLLSGLSTARIITIVLI